MSLSLFFPSPIFHLQITQKKEKKMENIQDTWDPLIQGWLLVNGYP